LTDLKGFDLDYKIKEIDKPFKKNWKVILGGVFVIALLIRIFESPLELPISQDAIQFFFYATDITVNNQLPNNYTPTNNGWPIFLSLFFSVFEFELTQNYMAIQKNLSIIISSITVVPIFFLCRKYVGIFYGLIGSFIFSVEPKIIQNSTLGISEPLFIFLSVISFVIFLNSKTKIIYLSFVIVTFASMIRGEGVLLLISMFILFIIRFRKEKQVIVKTLLIISIVFLIMLPMSMYRVDVIDNDGMFLRLSSSSSGIISEKIGNSNNNYFMNGLDNFPKFLGWSMIPIFLPFLPLGIVMILKKKNFETATIVIPTILVSLSALHAYSVPALDTRYLFPLYPFFIVISLFGIKFLIEKTAKPKISFTVILIFIILSTSIYSNLKSIDYEHELEVFLISKKITTDFKTMNQFYPESSYLEPADFPIRWSEFKTNFENQRIEGVSVRQTIPHNYQLIPVNENDSLETFIEKNIKKLDHIVVDDRKDRPQFFEELFYNENRYEYLKKIYDSKEDGFEYHMKIFEIQYEKFNTNNERLN